MIQRAAVGLTLLMSMIAFGQRRVPPPMFSKAYLEAFKDVLDLEPRDAARLEKVLAKDPDNFAARLKLIVYYEGSEKHRDHRMELILWLVEHRPESEILGAPDAQILKDDWKPDQWNRVVGLWRSALQTHPSDARVAWNAAKFFQNLDAQSYLVCLRRAVALTPDNENYGVPLGILYAETILTMPPVLARSALQELETTKNAPMLEAAVKMFQGEYNKSLMMGSANRSAGDLAQRFFRRAKALDPGLDEAWIFPKLDPKMRGMLIPSARPLEDNSARANAPATPVRRLAPAAFPKLPRAVGAILEGRRCRVPQPEMPPNPAPLNVIRGEFFSKGQTGWAALCLARGFSSILVFRDDTDASPLELLKRKDKGDMYSYTIHPADRKLIMRQYRAHGGPAPPPIDHHGIDVVYDRSSTTYYLHRGKWRQLQGAN